MHILIMTGPHSKVREITLTVRNLVFGVAVALMLLVGANAMIHSVSNETKDLLHAMEKKVLLEKRFIANSEDDYETKLMELQARLDEAQKNLSQLDALRTQLIGSNGVVHLSNADFNSLTYDGGTYTNHYNSYAGNVVNLGAPQGGPLSPSKVVIHLGNQGNQGEQYGVRLDRILQDSITLNTRVQAVQKSFNKSGDLASAMPSGSPLPLMPQASSGLGYRDDPLTGQSAWHEGTDFPAAYGTPILATAEGIVMRAGWDEEYGYVVDIKHKNAVITRYAHAQELLVKPGEFVKPSQMIAKVGSSGRSTGPHLHYEILRDGVVLTQK